MNRNIPTTELLMQRVFSIKNDKEFTSIALEVFNFQYNNNTIYQAYCDLIHKNSGNVRILADIPYLPISFFKSHLVCSTSFEPEIIFESSRTTGTLPSKHFIKSIAVYRDSFLTTFRQVYGHPEDYCFLGLLPSYLERTGSSLVFMVDELIKKSKHPLSAFYLYDFDKLANALENLERGGQKTILIGVTHALLDFAATHPMKLAHTIIMETGGMKGRRKEMIRSEVHAVLKEAFKINLIHSEYGMTELMSQAYAVNEGIFYAPKWMKFLLREEDDPLSVSDNELKSGALNIIDLANLYSCSFIATEDMGKQNENGGVEILGRLDNSEIRGCSLLAL